MSDRQPRTRLATKFLLYYTVAYLVLAALAAFLVERALVLADVAIVAVALGAGLIGAAVVWWLGHRLGRSIDDLTERALAAAEGSAEPQPRSLSVRELDQLDLAISRLADDLGSRLDEARDASETLEVVLGALPQGTVLVGADDRIEYANPSAYSLLGVVPDQIQGLSPFQFQTIVQRARKTREQASRIADHGKPVRRLRGVATPFSDDLRVLLVVVDITERERADAIRRDFVANASHELKTPVSTLIASAEALQMALERGDESALSFARQIESSARQLDRMVGDLLDLSRLERESPEMSPVRLDLIAGAEIERAGVQAEERSIDLRLTAEPVTVRGNQSDLATAIRNLLDNAIRYTGPGGEIEVIVEGGDFGGVVTVRDTGEGIPSRGLDRVFERFYRVDSARARATGGTGLGLAIVKHIAESHGGSVSVESELGVGSAFTLRLPPADS